MKKRRFPNTYVIIAAVLVLCAVASWFVPGGKYVTAEDGTLVYTSVEAAPQTWQVFTALYDGFVRQAGIIIFILIVGGAFWVLNATGAINAGISRFISAVGRRDRLVLACIAVFFSLAGAVFGSVEIEGLDLQSLQADITITDILVDAGAVVSQLEMPADENHPDSASKSLVCVRKAPLEAFETDLSHAPDLFPITAVLASFCSGESHIAGIGRLAGKESNRADAILEMLLQMGVEARIEGDELSVCGESLASRSWNASRFSAASTSSFDQERTVRPFRCR